MDSTIKFFSKQNCLACKLVRERLQQYQVPYTEIFDHNKSSPTLIYNGYGLYPPITTIKLKQYLKQVQLL